MKSLLLIDERHDLLATLEPVLKHWGYRVLTATNVDQGMAFLASSSPSLLLVGANLCASPQMQLPDPHPPLLMLAHPDTPPSAELADFTLDVPVDIFALFSFIQNHVEHHPRQNLRLRLRIPGMYRHNGDQFVLADVLSLSMHGLFFRSPTRLAKGDQVSAVFPLLGFSQELELTGKVLYTIEPSSANNYAQGFALGFDQLDSVQKDLLGRFIADSFLSEVSTCQAGVGTFSAAHLQY